MAAVFRKLWNSSLHDIALEEVAKPMLHDRRMASPFQHQSALEAARFFADTLLTCLAHLFDTPSTSSDPTALTGVSPALEFCGFTARPSIEVPTTASEPLPSNQYLRTNTFEPLPSNHYLRTNTFESIPSSPGTQLSTSSLTNWDRYQQIPGNGLLQGCQQLVDIDREQRTIH
ncbi:hypothetical protein EG327_010266 [Venturia inaequalis]|uniref:Uncharacterized protein n=1 Tax=Venturia inaequalis TaxID=5025 RepID=A0A8H3VMQ5_VENIN|nr:hypothetical protein EG327_010266 [Venturia inaequalis]